MTLTISIDTILFLLALLGCAVLVALIILFRKLSSLISNVDTLLVQNSTNVGLAIADPDGFAKLVAVAKENLA